MTLDLATIEEAVDRFSTTSCQFFGPNSRKAQSALRQWIDIDAPALLAEVRLLRGAERAQYKLEVLLGNHRRRMEAGETELDSLRGFYNAAKMLVER